MENKNKVAQHFADRCANPNHPLEPIYLEDFQNLQWVIPHLTKNGFERDVDLQNIPKNAALILTAKMQSMEDVGKRPSQLLETTVVVQEASYQDGQLMLSTADGRFFCTYDFSKEWQAKLDYQRDELICKMAAQAVFEKDEFFKPRTLALVKELGYDLELLGFKDRSFLNPRLKQLNQELCDYFKRNNLPRILDRDERYSDRHIAGIKATIEKSMMSPMIAKRDAVIAQVMDHCEQNDIPLVHTSTLTFLNPNSIIPITAKDMCDQFHQHGADGTKTTMLTQESDMLMPGVDVTDVQHVGEKILDIQQLDVGFVVMTESAVYMTFDQSEQWEQYLKIHAPEKVAKAYNPVHEVDGQLSFLPKPNEHTWIPQDLIDKKEATITEEEMIKVSKDMYDRGYLISQSECEFRAVMQRSTDFYTDLFKLAMEDGKTVTTPCKALEDQILVYDGIGWTPIELESIEPGMAINIGGDTHFVEDCLVLGGVATIVTADAMLVSSDMDWIARGVAMEMEKGIEEQAHDLEK